MHLDMTGRHVEITPALREFAEEKLGKLEKLLDGPVEFHVVLAIEKHRHLAEIQVKASNVVLSGARETGDLYASIGEVADKLEAQARKHKDKLRDHKHRMSPRDAAVAAAIEGVTAEPDPAETPQLPRLVRSANYRLKPLSPEDAAMELEASGDEVLVFRDLQSDRLNVVYRRKDGHFGLVEPEF